MRKSGPDEDKKRRTQRLLKILSGLAGRYKSVVVGVIVVIAILFGSDVVRIVSLSRDIARLERRKTYYTETIRQDSTVLRNLDDDEFLERFARERYLMRRKGEQIYIVEKQR